MRGSTYEIRVEGTVSDEALDALALQVDGLRVSVEPVLTVLEGPLEDEAALKGVLARLESIGAVVVEVRRVTPDAEVWPA